MNLNDLANQVTDERSLIDFIEALSRDRKNATEKENVSQSAPYGSDANGWANTTIQGFLSAAASWTGDTQNDTENYKKPNNPWTRFAHILLMGKMYE